MAEHRLGADDLPALLGLARGYAFNPYRNYRALSQTARGAVLGAEVEATLLHPDGVVYGGAPAAVVARRLAWDSAFFGVPMARVEYLLGDDPERCLGALRACLDALRAEGVRHVSARIDVADLTTIGVLEECGFRLRDAMVTYVARPRKEPAKPIRALGTVRMFREDDGPALIEIARDAFRGYRGRFHADPELPRDRVEGFYEEWARQCLNGAMADTVIVSEGARGLLGFLAWRRREPVSSVSGVPIFGGGLGACRPDAPGAYAGLIIAGTRWAHENGGVAECQTQNFNYPAIRVHESVGAHYVRAEYAFHASLRP